MSEMGLKKCKGLIKEGRARGEALQAKGQCGLKHRNRKGMGMCGEQISKLERWVGAKGWKAWNIQDFVLNKANNQESLQVLSRREV